jgi:hypothetical protein
MDADWGRPGADPSLAVAQPVGRLREENRRAEHRLVGGADSWGLVTHRPRRAGPAHMLASTLADHPRLIGRVGCSGKALLITNVHLWAGGGCGSPA